LIDMIAIVVLILGVIVALAVFGAVLHLLFSPWLLVGALIVLALLRFRPRRSRP
jgi:hypothetical protein